jgi:hypothetical protein
MTDHDDSLLTKAARAIGGAAGKVASTVGIGAHDTPALAHTRGKLPKKNKARLPRKQKKAMRKSARKPG